MFNAPKSIPEFSEQEAARFWGKVNIGGVNDCWTWKNATFLNGYGAFRKVVSTNKYRQLVASRVAYYLSTGTQPAGLFVCHHCDNPLCCNPTHLFLGTASENELDKHAKGRNPNQHGELGRTAKLTWDEVDEIRKRLNAGDSQRFLAKMFHVGQSTIGHIYRLKTWRPSAHP